MDGVSQNAQSIQSNSSPYLTDKYRSKEATNTVSGIALSILGAVGVAAVSCVIAPLKTRVALCSVFGAVGAGGLLMAAVGLKQRANIRRAERENPPERP
jgi:hypothetical protein